MPNRSSLTPLHAAFFFAALLAACGSAGPGPAAAVCQGQVTPIAAVQGDSTTSPLRGQTVSVRGVVTLVREGQGVYIEEPGSDGDGRTSDAVFIRHADLPAGLAAGAVVRASGTVAEIGKGDDTLTAITGVGQFLECGPAQALPATAVTMPLESDRREALEGMRVEVAGPLTVTDVYRLAQGDFTLSGNGLRYVPTESMGPGREAAAAAARDLAYTMPAHLRGGVGRPQPLANGTSFDAATGVLAHDGRELRLWLQTLPERPPAAIPAAPAAGDDAVRIVGTNLRNYFNGDGKGGGFPAARGAATAGEFRLQRERIAAAIAALDPQVLAVMELENDGFGPDSAASDLIRLADRATGGRWAVVRPPGDDTGGDLIAVGLLYETGRARAIGPALTLTGAEFRRSRQPLAQLFELLPGGNRILVVVNHLKSKGSCPDGGADADQDDGQGCWNPVRLASAEKMAAWANNVATGAGTDRILVLGDLNAYRREEPIDAIRAAGFIELMDAGPAPVHSAAFYGRHGTLDYAFASRALLADVERAFIWNVNTVLPPGARVAQAWVGFSDHDPVIVDVRSRQASTSD